MAGRVRLGDLLIEKGAITKEQFQTAMDYKKSKGAGKRLGQILIELGLTTDKVIAKALADQLGIKLVELHGVEIDRKILEGINPIVLRKDTVIPLCYDKKDASLLYLAMADPQDVNAIQDIELQTNSRVEPIVAAESEINALIDRYFGNAEAMSAVEKYSQEREARESAFVEEEEVDEQALSNAPIVQLVKTMIEQAVRLRSSDIHIDALERSVRVRYRIDGALIEKLRYDISLLPALSTRIKIVSGLDIAEKRKPQDGRMTQVVDQVEYDIRVAILPTVYGEKIVMRLTEANALTKPKEKLGMQPHELELFSRIIKNPNGIILVTGPTGSGKSTTLYTALAELNTEDVNILTVEDPVEANIAGINQVQVNVKAGLTFATALRSFLRQDPDIIMLGEIRDQETAEIAVQASITGHLVVSTLHTNSSAASVTRLLDMGLESYLLADSLRGIIAQRLVRRLCEDCKEEVEADNTEMRAMGLPLSGPHPKIFHPKGCPKCNGTGYYGRIGIFEVMEMTPAIRDIVARAGTTHEIEEEAHENGLRTLKDNAVYYILQGITTVPEMLKVTSRVADEEEGSSGHSGDIDGASSIDEAALKEAARISAFMNKTA